jgi:hypothetical protein
MRYAPRNGERNWQGISADYDYHFSVLPLQGRKHREAHNEFTLRLPPFNPIKMQLSTCLRCSCRLETLPQIYLKIAPLDLRTVMRPQGAGFPVSFA